MSPESGSRQGEVALALALLLLALYVAWTALRMPLGTAAAPGPGVLPAILGGALSVVSVALIIRAVVRGSGRAAAARPVSHPNVWIALAALVVFAFALEYAGYLVSAAAFMLVLLRAFSRLGWLRSLLAAAIAALVSFYFFSTLLGVALPRGLLALAR